MDFGHYNDLAVIAAADLVNTVGSHTGAELMPGLDDARAFLAEHRFSYAGDLADSDLSGLRILRRRLRDIFFAGDESAAIGMLNHLLDDLEIKPYLTDHDGDWHFHYTSDDAPVSLRVATTLVMGLATMIAEHGFDRVGICAAADCADVFIDTSRNRSRRFCGEGCSSRTNVAAFRARSKEATERDR